MAETKSLILHIVYRVMVMAAMKPKIARGPLHCFMKMGCQTPVIPKYRAKS